MSLSKPHPIWWTAGSSPHKIAMATIQARMVSGRFRTASLCSHWSRNIDGNCQLSDSCSNTSEDISHILTSCVALQPTRQKLYSFTSNYCTNVSPVIRNILEQFCTQSSERFCQFLLDCSVLPAVIRAVQEEGNDVLHHLFTVTRTWVYTLHKERLKKLGRWNLK